MFISSFLLDARVPKKKVIVIPLQQQLAYWHQLILNHNFLKRSDAVLIDVRKPEEFSEGIISGADNIDFTAPDFTNKIAGLDRSKPYFVYCKSGKRSANAVSQMKEMGFKNLYTLDGGLNNWKDQGLEIVKPD